MSFLTSYLNQDATYWQRTGQDGYGQSVFAAPISIKVRWENRTELINNPEGVQVLSKSRVFLSMDVVAGDYLKEGISAELDPHAALGAFEVLTFIRIPDLEGIDFERRAML